MSFPILLRRELKSVARDPRTAVVFGIVNLFILVVTDLGFGSSYTHNSRDLVVTALITIALAVAFIMGDTFARESSSDTAALVRLSAVSPWAVLTAKVVAGYIVGLLALACVGIFSLIHAIVGPTVTLTWLALSLGFFGPLVLILFVTTVLSVGVWIRIPRLATPLAVVVAVSLVIPTIEHDPRLPSPLIPFASAMRAAAWGEAPNMIELFIVFAVWLVAAVVAMRLGYAKMRTSIPGGE